jgi:hypothetical protein
MAVEISEEDDSQPGGYHLKMILRGSAQIVRRL